MAIDGLLLDLDNTIYNYDEAHAPALSAALSWLSTSLGRAPDEVDAFYRDARKRVNQRLHGMASSHSRLLYFQDVCESFKQFPCQIALHAENVYWSHFLQNMQLRSECLDFLKAWQPKPIAIVTDLTSRIQFEKVTHLGLNPYVQAIVTSEEAGHEKPHPDIFMMAAEKLALLPQNLCMVGDSLERDVKGALALSMPCFWFSEEQNGEELEANVIRFNRFGQLLELIQACG